MKLSTEARSALLSARAKNRKAGAALLNGGVELPKAIAKHLTALEAYYNKQLAPAAKKAQPKAEKKAA